MCSFQHNIEASFLHQRVNKLFIVLQIAGRRQLCYCGKPDRVNDERLAALNRAEIRNACGNDGVYGKLMV